MDYKNTVYDDDGRPVSLADRANFPPRHIFFDVFGKPISPDREKKKKEWEAAIERSLVVRPVKYDPNVDMHKSSKRDSRKAAAARSRKEKHEQVNGISSDEVAGAECPPSLERVGERRPSLDRKTGQGAERRPSLERDNQCQGASSSGRRPSLDRAQKRERRPSLDRSEQQGAERRPSLERSPKASNGAQDPGEEETSEIASSQGINTLRPAPLTQEGIPENWDNNQLPEYGGDCNYCLVSLSAIDKEYSAITVDFEEAGLKVLSVQRLQNLILVERFSAEKEHLLKHRPTDFLLNERYLYHGTRANKECLCEEGLDFRLSFQGCFGRGTYFSDNPRKCMHYATNTSYGSDGKVQSMILVCRVVLGESKVYAHFAKDSELKREPVKPNGKGGYKKYYDSVQGIPIDYPEFVVYDNRRSMIEYIVMFEEVEKRAPPPLQSRSSHQQSSTRLYRCDPIVLPIPEEELDILYMLEADTDSDGSCDEQTKEVERLRENVKRGKAKMLGIPFRHPTKAEKRFERLHWKRVCYYSCPPKSPFFELMVMKKTADKKERKKLRAEAAAKALEEGGGEGDTEAPEASGGTSPDTSEMEADKSVSSPTDTGLPPTQDDGVGQVLDSLIAEFLCITDTDDANEARNYIMENNMDMDQALNHYYREMP